MPDKCIQSKKILFAAFFLAGFFAAHYASAHIVIDEIMYDISGSDAGREWIEVHNEGKESINFSKWKFSEGNSNHGLIAVKGSSVISTGEYAVIVGNPDTFKNDWPDFAGTIFDSAFSLSNTGETLSLKDSNLNVSDEVSYSSTWGAVGDGKSLQRADSKWGTGAPTPGLPNVIVSVANSGADQPSAQISIAADNQNKISLSITSKNTGAVGEKLFFESIASDSSGALLKNGKYIWNFGDGSIVEDKTGGSASHTYLYSGDYVAVVDYFQDEGSSAPDANARITVHVSESNAAMREDSRFVSTQSASAEAVSRKQKDSDKNIKSSSDDSGSYVEPAQVSDGLKKSDTNIYFWLVALLGLIIASVGSVFFLGKSKTASTHESDEIEIID